MENEAATALRNLGYIDILRTKYLLNSPSHEKRLGVAANKRSNALLKTRAYCF